MFFRKNTMTDDIREIAAKIGQFYLNKNNYDYNITRKELLELNIHNIQIINFPFKKILIYTSRPGLLIGKRGQNFKALEAWIGYPIEIKEQENLLWYLVPEEQYDLCEM